MAGQLDEGVSNLEAFLGVLEDTISKVNEANPTLKEHGEALETLDQDAAEELGGFDRELDAALQETGSLADAAGDEVEKLENTARGGTDGVLSEAADGFEEWEDKLGSTLDDAAETVRDGASDLTSDGFEPAGEAVESAGSALESSQDTTENAFDAFTAALEQLGSRFAGSLVTAAMKAEESAQQAGELESDFEGKADSRTSEIQGDSTGALGVHAETKESAGTLYDAASGRVQSEAQELMDGQKDAFSEAAQQMRDTAEAPLGEPVDTVESDALEPHANEVDAWAQLAEAAEQGLSAFDPLVEDLERSERVAEVIEELNREVG